MRNKRTLAYLLVSAIITACSSNVNPVNTTNKTDKNSAAGFSNNQNNILSDQEIADFNKEYSFSTKALLKDYLKRKLVKWLSSPVYGHLLVKEIAYARYKHPALFCTVITENPDILININKVTQVSDRTIFDIPFKNFLESCFPKPQGELTINNNGNLPSVAMDSAGDFVSAWESPFDGSYYGIHAQRYSSTGSLTGSEFQVNTYTTGTQRYPSVAMDSAGDFVITWHSGYYFGIGQDGSSYGIYAQRYNSSGVAQGSEFQVNSYTTGNQYLSKVAMDSAGDFVITWGSNYQDGNGFGVYAQRYNRSGATVGSEFQVNTHTNDTQNLSAVAMDSAGDFVITWRSSSQDGSGDGIYAQMFNSNGDKVGSEFRVNSYISNSQRDPSIAMDSAGDFVVAWRSYQDGSNYGNYAQRYNSSGVAQGTEFRVNSYTTSYQGEPAIAMDTAGDFVISWTSRSFTGISQDGDGFGVFAQRYNSGGATVGSEFQVNTYTTNQQHSPAVGMDSAGDFVVSWTSKGQNGNGGYGIYSQRYDSSGVAQ